MTVVVFSLSREGTVERFCVERETTSRTRESVLVVLRTFEPEVALPEEIAVCLVGKRLRSKFSRFPQPR